MLKISRQKDDGEQDTIFVEGKQQFYSGWADPTMSTDTVIFRPR